MQLAFTLNMPGRNSWNGKWSGDDKLFVIVQTFQGAGQIEKARQIAAKGSYSYDFGDGWAARIDVRIIEPGEAQGLREKSAGFCGYDWMVKSIVKHGAIYVDDPTPAAAS